MGTAVGRRHFRWELLIYAVLLGPLRLLYVTAGRAYGTEGLGADLPRMWWLLTLLYFVADVIMLLGLTVLWRVRVGSGSPSKESFWHVVSELVPLLFLYHLWMLLSEYPIRVRLESVGLGKLELIGFIAFLVGAAAYFFRLIERERPPIAQVPSSLKENIAIYSALLLGVCILLSIPYFAARPLSRDALMHTTDRR
jgi:hypothetical protein